MVSSTELFDLIKKMTKSEKRYFSLNSSPQEGSKAYLALFQEIDKMPSYDEAILKERLSSKGFNVDNLAVAKLNLTKLILKSLRSFYEGKSPEHNILSMLLEAEILKNKGLYRLAIKYLEKAKESAIKYEMHFHIFQIIVRLIEIHSALFRKGTTERMEELFEELETLKKVACHEADVRVLLNKIFLILSSKSMRDPATLAAIKQLETHPAAQGIDSSHTFYAKSFYFAFKGFLNHAKGDFATANPNYRKVLEIWNSYPHIRDTNPRFYKAHISNYLNSCHTLENYEVFDEWLEKFENIKDANFDEEAGSFKDFYHIKLLYFLNTAQFKKALEIVPPIAHGLVAYQEKIGKPRETTLRFNVFLVFFLNEKFSEALEWLGAMKLEDKLDAKADSRTLARVMRLIVHYELGNIRMLDDLRNSVYRKLKKQDRLHEFERAILDHIRLLEQAIDKKEKKDLFQELITKLNDIGNTFGFNKIIGLEEIISWAESRHQNKPYLEVLEARKKH